MRKRLVFVEDDDVIRENYAELLTDEGFEVEAFGDRHAALERVRQAMPDIALLDISLNDERDAGFQLCADLRRLSQQLPIVFLTSHDTEMDKVSGIRLGADDYLTKDLSTNFLVIRIEALLRRFEALRRDSSATDAGAEDAAAKLVCGPLTVDQDKFAVYWRQHKVELTLTQFWITQKLAASPCKVQSYTRLMAAANIRVEPNTIAAHVKTIRDSFKIVDDGFDRIKTERGIGYRWLDA